MKKIRNIISIFMIGFVAGMLFWYLASPIWIDRVVNEQANVSAADVTVKTGNFKDADGAHKGSGKVSLTLSNGRHILRFEDFKVTNGPDLYVWLVKSPNPIDSQVVKDSETFELGQLKGNIGNQNYDIPSDVDIGQYGAVVIWCRQFGVLFASAEFQ